MHNRSAFADDIRIAVEEMLDATASVDSTRRAHLGAAGRAVTRAMNSSGTPEETQMVDRIGELLSDMQAREG